MRASVLLRSSSAPLKLHQFLSVLITSTVSRETLARTQRVGGEICMVIGGRVCKIARGGETATDMRATVTKKGNTSR